VFVDCLTVSIAVYISKAQSLEDEEILTLRKTGYAVVAPICFREK